MPRLIVAVLLVSALGLGLGPAAPVSEGASPPPRLVVFEGFMRST
jgi:hypothetical protein